jgi:hypothetical protein
MRRRRIRGFAIVGATGGAIVGAALLASPMAYADDVATLPLPPYNPNTLPSSLFPPGTGGDWTNVEDSGFPSYAVQYDQAYTVSDGSYEIQGVQEPSNGLPEPWFNYGSEQVISSDGVAPPVGTEWSGETFQIPSWGFEYTIFENESMTTPAGMVDLFTPENIPFLQGWTNEFYNGPAGIFDDLVSDNGGATVIPIIDMPAETSSAAAADFSTLWSDLAAMF